MEPHYTFHFELQRLNKKILSLSSLVEDRVSRAVQIIKNQDPLQIQDIIRSDYEIDEMEVEIEEDCLKILALHQPVARDLRFIIAVIKINNEMERIADIAVNISLRIQTIMKDCNTEFINQFDFNRMSTVVLQMLRMSLDALVNRDSSMARKIFHLDDDVDAYRNEVYEKVKGMITKYPDHPGCMINVYLLARHLERIGDRATNIAEEVIYLVEGSVVRGN